MSQIAKKILVVLVAVLFLMPLAAEAKKKAEATDAAGKEDNGADTTKMIAPDQPRNFTKSGTLPGGIKVDFTVVTLAKFSKDIDQVFKYTFDETSRIAELFNSTDASSDLAKVAAAAGQAPVAVNKETLVLVEHAKEIADWSRGAYDPVSGASYHSIKINKENSTIMLGKAGTSLDVRGILEGFIADLFIRAAYHASLDDAYVKVGGAIRSMGRASYGPWQFTVTGNGDKLAKTGIGVTISNYSAAIVGGEYSAPTTDKKGKPIKSEFYQVVVLSKQAATSQGVASAVYVLGENAGEGLINSLGIRAILSYPDGKLKKIGRW